MFKTIKAANDVGYRKRKKYEYGGEEIEVKGRKLYRNPQVAFSKTAWKEMGYLVKDGELPHAEMGYEGYRRWDVYRQDQVVDIQTNSRYSPILGCVVPMMTWNEFEDYD